MYLLQLASASDTIDFLSDSVRLSDGGLSIETPKKNQKWEAASRFGLGARLLSNYYDNRGVKIEFAVHGADKQGVADVISRIEALLETARDRAIEGSQDRVELRILWGDPSTEKTVYYEVADGEFSLPGNVMSVENILQTAPYQNVMNGAVIYDCTLELTVYPHAYGISPVNGSPIEVPLTNGNGTNVLGGLAVYSHDDAGAGHDNWVDISGADVPGDAPALAVIRIEKVNGSALPARVSIGQCLKKTTMFSHILEDNAITASSGATQVSNPGGSSGDTYTNFSFTSVDPLKFAEWTIANAHLYGGKPYRVVGVSHLGSGWSNTMNYQLRLTSSNNDVYFQTDWVSPVEVSSHYIDFGVVVLPPFQGDLGDIEDIKLNLWGFRKVAGTTAFSIDYLFLVPIEKGYRALQNKMPVVAGAWGTFITDDPWNGRTYATQNNKNLGTFDALFAPVRLVPKKDQRLYFSFQDIFDFQPASFNYKVQVWIVPLYKILA